MEEGASCWMRSSVEVREERTEERTEARDGRWEAALTATDAAAEAAAEAANTAASADGRGERERGSDDMEREEAADSRAALGCVHH